MLDIKKKLNSKVPGDCLFNVFMKFKENYLLAVYAFLISRGDYFVSRKIFGSKSSVHGVAGLYIQNISENLESKRLIKYFTKKPNINVSTN
jgi:hypothetical protein